MEIEIDYLGNRPEFLEELASLWHKEWFGETNFPLENLKMNFKTRLSIHDLPFILIAIQNGKLLGSAAVSIRDLNSKPDLGPWVVGVIVKPEFRGKMVATRLIARALENAKNLNYNILYLHTEFAHGLYEKLGWQYLEHTINDQGLESDIYYINL